MPKHRNRRATPPGAKYGPPHSGRAEPPAGRRRLLARGAATRLRCAPCRRAAPRDHGHWQLWVWALGDADPKR